MSSKLSLGIATHISWALRLTEEQAKQMTEIVEQWDDLTEGSEAFAACESPAERLFLFGFLLSESISVDWEDYALTFADPPRVTPNFVFTAELNESSVTLKQQVKVGEYRVDFLAETANAENRLSRVAIEIDGHDFHERTKEQAAHDRRRDRFLVANGYTPVRFTASEVYQSPDGCAVELMKLCATLEEESDDIQRRVERAFDYAFERGREQALDELTAPAPAVALLPAPAGDAE